MGFISPVLILVGEDIFYVIVDTDQNHEWEECVKAIVRMIVRMLVRMIKRS